MKFIALLSGLILSVPALADTYTYTYTGNNFTTATAPYTTDDFITGSFTLSAPLPANFNNEVSPISQEFTDGVVTFGDPADINLFEIETDSSGSIEVWVISESETPLNGVTLQLLTQSGGAGDGNDQAREIDINHPLAHIESDPGTWTETVNPSAVPEPGSFGLLATGLLGALISVRRKLIHI